MILDLFKSAVGKGQTSRRAELESTVKYLQDNMKMNRQQAEEEAEKMLLAKVPRVVKIPSSFHLKLY
jgi:hypothetical protein